MRILFIADGRSQIALNWIEFFTQREHEVHLVSTFQCDSTLKLASRQVVPVAFSSLKRLAPQRRRIDETGMLTAENKANSLKEGMWGARTVGLRTSLRQWLGPLTLAGLPASWRR